MYDTNYEFNDAPYVIIRVCDNSLLSILHGSMDKREKNPK